LRSKGERLNVVQRWVKARGEEMEAAALLTMESISGRDSGVGFASLAM
jgi:uridine phosphorylase